MARFIKYIGTSHVRQILEKEWAALEPPVENASLVWNRANGWTIPADMVSEHAWPYIEADSELVLIDKDYRGLADSDTDTAEADTNLFPPLITAEQAETFTPENVPPRVLAEEPPMDQSTGSVSINDELD